MPPLVVATQPSGATPSAAVTPFGILNAILMVGESSPHPCSGVNSTVTCLPGLTRDGSASVCANAGAVATTNAPTVSPAITTARLIIVCARSRSREVVRW